jgi:hypothetical protein
MDIIESSLRRIDATILTIKNLEDSEFPYLHSEKALQEVERIFDETRLSLTRARESNDQSLRKQTAEAALKRMLIYIPLLGFILRSTNVRNAFEIHGPLLRLSQSLLGNDIKLVLSSEWDYSPMTYLEDPLMKSFILIGFPAQESSNPFLIPLAGHELGHNLWFKKGIGHKVRSFVTQLIQEEIQINRHGKFLDLYKLDPRTKGWSWDDLFNKKIMGPATVWATSQAEETFCDYVGLRIFGPSFLHAFVYLLAPGQRSRGVTYPSSKTRISNLLDAAREWGLKVPTDYSGVFQQNEQGRSLEKDAFQLELAEFAVAELVPSLRDAANQLVQAAGIASIDPKSVLEVRKKIDLTVPAENAKSLATILEAGWDADRDETLWCNFEHLDADSKYENLKEIVLKSIEALEIQSRTGEQ